MDNLNKPYNLFFIIVFAFTFGILLASLGIDFNLIALSALIVATAVFPPMVFIAAGFFYFHFYGLVLADFNLLEQLAHNLSFIGEGIEAAYQKLLTINQSGLLAALTLGDTSNLSKELLNQLSLSGVRHLAALSGLHISIVVFGAIKVIRFLLPGRKKLIFILSVILALAFVIITGLRVSAMRAVFMAVVIGLASVIERGKSPRNTLAAAGFVLLLLDPTILVFDIGFQLSFLAVLGITYLMPLLKQLVKYKHPGFLNWRENLLVTISAQITTAPLLFYYFSTFTITGVAANILILPLVPATMALGYIIGISYYLFQPLAAPISWLTASLLEYKLVVINIFSNLW